MDDVTVLRKFLKLGRLFCLFPWDFEDKTGSIWTMYTYVTAMIYTTWVIAVYVMFVVFFNSNEGTRLDLCDSTLNNLEAFSWICSALACISSAVRHRAFWNNLLQNFVNIDAILIRNDCLLLNRKAHYTSIIWFHFYFFVGVCLSYRMPIDKYTVVMFLSARFILYQKILLLSTFTHLMLMLNNRYKCADLLLRKTYQGKRHFDDIKTILNQLIECIKGINAIMGYSLLMLIINSFVAVLGVFKHVIYAASNPDDVSTMAYVWERTTFFICTIVIIRRCEVVRRSYERVLLAGNELHAFTLDTSVRRELIQLLDYAENLVPTFTAAGYFKLNVSFISSYISSLISYLIIVLQFKTQALKEMGALGAGAPANGTVDPMTTTSIGGLGSTYGESGDVEG